MADGHGNVRMFADGNITDTYDYDAFGNLISKTGETENNYLYCGEQFDGTTGYYYLRARYMNPVTGTFTSMDSYAGRTADPVTLHKYLYANGNPVMNIDPSGNFSLGELNVTQTIQGILNKVHTINYANFFKRLAVNSAIGSVYNGVDTALGGGNIKEILLSMKDGAIAGAVLSIFVQYTVIRNILTAFGIVSISKGISDSIKDGKILQATVRAVAGIGLVYALCDGLALNKVSAEAEESSNIGKVLIEGFKKAEITNKKNPATGDMEPYIAQFQINSQYKVLMRRDIGAFSHGDSNHWNLEVQTLKGNIKYNLHIYVDDFGNVIRTEEYIPKK